MRAIIASSVFFRAVKTLAKILPGRGGWQRALLATSLAWGTASAGSYDLGAVKDIGAFQGSDAARELLAKNGFVVADPAFKQIFEPYIKSPMTEQPSETNHFGSYLPSFITTDSAWHTYHVMLEEGVKGMEEIETHRLRDFSRGLLATLNDPKNDCTNLAWFAAVGLALQDESVRQSLAPKIKRMVDGLRTGTTPVKVPVGFDLMPEQFRAQSFYAQSPELSDYFAARQWYACVAFRLADAPETRSALALAALVNGHPELLALWKQLSEPVDRFLAPAGDGTVLGYEAAAKSVMGNNHRFPSDSELAAIRKKLATELPLPQVNDQLMSPEQYLQFAKQTQGFRLLPPRRLPCAVCFQNTTDPKIPNRVYPSGLDFLAASPVLRSPAAARAVQSQFGKNVADLIAKADSGPLPDSLHGEAMKLLATLQKPLPPSAPPPLRTEAWEDLQLGTQLGAWAEQRHTWALHSKMSVMVMGIIEPPAGMVAPYPDFFSGLATLSRHTAASFAKAGLAERFDAKSVAGQIVGLFNLSDNFSRSPNEQDFEKVMGRLEPLSQFLNRYCKKHDAESEKIQFGEKIKIVQQELKDLARRCAASGTTNESDLETLRLFFDNPQDTAKMLNDFAPVCDRLAALAQKSLTGVTLTEDDAKWIENYGVTLAGFSFYSGNSYEVPRDDFPMVTRVFACPTTDSMLYAGLARPQALYVIVPSGNKPQLYRGAVLAYREFVRRNDQLLDDDSWRELISKGQTPPAPPFTRSFYAETSVGELLKKLRVQSRGEDFSYADLEDILWQIGARATDKDLPALLETLSRSNEEGAGGILDGMADIIANLRWEPNQKQLIKLLASPSNVKAGNAARILISRPAACDAALLIAGYEHQTPHARRLYCAILSRLPQPNDAARKLFLLALHDPNDGVRWQAVTAIKQAGWNDAQSQSALLAMLDDTNQFVTAAAAWSLARLGDTNAAPTLFAKLLSALKSGGVPIEELEEQSLRIKGDFRGEENHALNVLDPDGLELRLYVDAHVAANDRRRAAMRLPPMPFRPRMGSYNLATALMEALADLHYAPAAEELFNLRNSAHVLKNDYTEAATLALGKIAPDRLTSQLLATAKDKQTDSYLREQAMVTLCEISATNCVRELAQLLDDTTPIVYDRSPPGMEWRVCDRAAQSIAVLLGWQDGRFPMFLRPEQRDELMTRAREWAKQNP